MSEHELGIIGLRSIGGNLAKQAVEKEIDVVGELHSTDKPEPREKGVTLVNEYDVFVSELEPPCVVYLSLPAGPPVDTVLDELTPHLDEDDIVLDGGNSFSRDPMRREQELNEHKLDDIPNYVEDTGESIGWSKRRLTVKHQFQSSLSPSWNSSNPEETRMRPTERLHLCAMASAATHPERRRRSPRSGRRAGQNKSKSNG